MHLLEGSRRFCFTVTACQIEELGKAKVDSLALRDRRAAVGSPDTAEVQTGLWGGHVRRGNKVALHSNMCVRVHAKSLYVNHHTTNIL